MQLHDILLCRNDVCCRVFLHAPQGTSFPAAPGHHLPQADIIAHEMRISFRRKADKAIA